MFKPNDKQSDHSFWPTVNVSLTFSHTLRQSKDLLVLLRKTIFCVWRFAGKKKMVTRWGSVAPKKLLLENLKTFWSKKMKIFNSIVTLKYIGKGQGRDLSYGLFVSEAKSQVTHFWAISWVLNEAEIAL
jgi:hypothetical protein